MMFCVIDAETTGLDPVRHALISIAFIYKPDLSQDYEVSKREFKMNPGTYEIDPKALEVNGYTEEEIRSWPDRNETIKEIRRLILNKSGAFGKVVPVGHNYLFDQGFLLQIVSRNFYERNFHYHYLDTMNAANFINLARPKTFASVSLKGLCRKYGVENKRVHSALSDTEATAAVAKRMLEELKL